MGTKLRIIMFDKSLVSTMIYTGSLVRCSVDVCTATNYIKKKIFK